MAMLVITRGYPLNWSQKFQTANAANDNNRTLSQFYPKFSPKNHGSSSSWLAKVLQWQVLVGDAKRSKHHLSGPLGPSPTKGSVDDDHDMTGLLYGLLHGNGDLYGLLSGKLGFTSNDSHLRGIMIINHWVFSGTVFSDKPILHSTYLELGIYDDTCKK